MTAAELGKLGEKIAERYLKKHGYKILERNKHQSHNEIDLIVSDRTYIVFVEVKTRSASMANDLYLPYGSPASAVDRKKQLRTIRAAQDYLRIHESQGKQPRMDVVEVYNDKYTEKLLKINHISDAFGA